MRIEHLKLFQKLSWMFASLNRINPAAIQHCLLVLFCFIIDNLLLFASTCKYTRVYMKYIHTADYRLTVAFSV